MNNDGTREQQSQSTYNHSTDYTCGKRTAAVGTHSCAIISGQDRTPWTTQSSIWGAGGLLPHCMPPVPGIAFRPPFTGVFGKQDRCLGKQADNHDQSGLHIDVVLQTEEPRKQETAHQSAKAPTQKPRRVHASHTKAHRIR